MAEFVMYIFINEELGMSAGKKIAQGGHAVVESLKMTPQIRQDRWYIEDQKKIVLKAKTSEKLLNIQKRLTSEGLRTRQIRDLGLTEIAPNSLTALAIEILDKNIYERIFRKYSLLR